MIVGLCSAKGAPGVSTLAVAATAVMPGRAVLVEADAAGADGPFRLRTSDGHWLSPEPWLGSLATASRPGPVDPHGFAQDTLIGVRIVPGGRAPAELGPLDALWGHVAASLQAADDPVVVDFGRITAGHAAGALIEAADVLLVATATDTASLAHARNLAGRLIEQVGLGPDRGAKVMLVPVGDRLTVKARRVKKDVAAVLAAAGIPCPVPGVIPFDVKAATGLLSGPMTRYVAGSDLVRATQRMLTEIWRLRPDLAARVARYSPIEDGGDHEATRSSTAAGSATGPDYRSVAHG